MITPLMFKIILTAAVLVSPRQDGKPSWVDNPEKSYPNAQYLTAVGSGDSRKDAENSAASNLSKIFESNIKSEETINARYRELMKSQGQSSLESETNIDKNITVQTDQTLYNVRYPESYTDNLGRVYVLAAIEREPTADIYAKKIAENENRINEYVSRSRDVSEPVRKYSLLNAALVVAGANDILRQQLVIIMPGTPASGKPQYSLERLAEMCADARKNMPFSIKITGENRDKVADMIAGVLSDMGFIVSGSGILTIEGTTDIRKIELQSEQKFVRWSYSLSVYDRDRNVVASLAENGREGHLNYEEASARALRTMKKKIQSNFAKQLNQYLDGLTVK